MNKPLPVMLEVHSKMIVGEKSSDTPEIKIDGGLIHSATDKWESKRPFALLHTYGGFPVRTYFAMENELFCIGKVPGHRTLVRLVREGDRTYLEQFRIAVL
jgi:hypothetical protein